MKSFLTIALTVAMIGQGIQTLSVKQSTMTLSKDGRVLMRCTSAELFKEWENITDCKLEGDVTVTDIVRILDGEIRRMQDEQRQMIKYDEVCARWGRWHYRKGSSLSWAGGGTFTPNDRYRVCLVQKRVYQEELQP